MTAAELGELLEVSQRTIYRDIADLQTSGVPIDGEAGVGYVLNSGFDVPPLMFTREEVVSLIAGARLIQAWGGASMARAALQAIDKIEGVLPDSVRTETQRVEIHAVAYGFADDVRERIDQLEQSVQNRHRLKLEYSDADGNRSSRVVWPLGLWFWGKVWTLVAWCEMRDDFRMFRIDRIVQMNPTDPPFPADPNRSLQQFYRTMEEECGARIPRSEDAKQ